MYPDPDTDAIGSYNTPTSDFSIHSFAIYHTTYHGFGQEMTLNHGSWHLEVGRGLEFQMTVIGCGVPDLNLRVAKDKKTPNASKARPVIL